MSMIDRHLLRYFIAVVDRGNFSAAARHCKVAQPTLSVGIARLEEEIGHRLFERTNRRVVLTPAGARLTAPARRAENAFVDAERAVLDFAPPPTVRIGVMSTLPGAWVGEAIAHAVGSASERVEIVEARAKDLQVLLERDRIDAAIGLRGDGPGRTLWTEDYKLALSASHQLAGRTSLRAEEISSETMFVRRSCEALPAISRHFTGRGIRPFMAARTDNDDRAIAYVKAGLGVTMMPACFATNGVSMVALAGFDVTRTIGVTLGAARGNLIDDCDALRRLMNALSRLAGAAGGACRTLGAGAFA